MILSFSSIHAPRHHVAVSHRGSDHGPTPHDDAFEVVLVGDPEEIAAAALTGSTSRTFDWTLGIMRARRRARGAGRLWRSFPSSQIERLEVNGGP